MRDTWGEAFKYAFKTTGDTWDDVTTTLTPEEMYEEFDAGYGSVEGKPFTGWSKDWVYFPGMYDGAEWVDFVPRNPCDIKTNHIGGG